MRIGIDGRCLQNSRNTGVEEYTQGLISRLVRENNEDQFIIFLNAFGEIREELDWLKDYENVQVKRFRFPNKLLNFGFWFLNWPKADNLLGGLDFFISPNFHFTALTKSCRRILTVHDLSFERMPETFSWKRRLWHFFINPRKVVREAYKIWAVSESTAQDLINLYQVKSDKIIVNHPFFNFEFFNQARKFNPAIVERYNLPEQFILFLGTIEPRKNIKGLIRGFESFKKRNDWTKEYKLVIAGEKGWLWQSTIERVRSSSFEKDIIFTGFVVEKDKPALYSLAKIFVYPSFYEGFGFPPLEAMASGIPTIASSCSSMPEVLGDGAILIDPYKSFEICLALEILLKDERVYQEYSRKGQEQAQKIAEIKRNFKII
ncbi:MAG: glycosyltransferase family 4 protein [Candidatus Moranbacteria bacterium]|nr:glycosyltransferase family 4 protein [Candidatus Moranbacteria bacterium]